MLKIKNLCVLVENKQIINNINLTIDVGKVYALMGPNGSGKSTLAYALMGHPHYQITKGSLCFEGEDITECAIDVRARKGIFLSFQQPHAIPGVTVFDFLHEAYQAVKESKIAIKEFDAVLSAVMQQLQIDASFAHRALNDGFSGGEKKRFELLQLLVLQPKFAILDEIDSGLDVDALKMVSHGIVFAREHNPAMSILLITHYQRILEYIVPDEVHILHRGTIISSGDAQLAQKIDRQGYETRI